MKFSAAASLTLASAANAALRVTVSSSSVWWAANSPNTLSWACKNSPFRSFTVLIGNKNPKIIAAPMPFMAIVQNAECSRKVTYQQASLPPVTSYILYFVNPLDNTEVYAQSEEFELKPFGSAYPSQQQPSSPASGPSDSGSSTAPVPTQSEGGKGAKNEESQSPLQND